MGRPKRYCDVDDCGSDAVGWGMCNTHYQRWAKWGDPHRVNGRWTLSAEDRFWQYVDKADDCWRWTGGEKNGYGTFFLNGRSVQAHRYAYELSFGPIPAGFTLDHACHTAVAAVCGDGARCPHRSCVRPDHMEPLSLEDNIARGGNGAKTHCKRGHEFTPENTYVMKRGGRSCRACLRLHQANQRARRRELRAS